MAIIIPVITPNYGAIIAMQMAERKRAADCSAWMPGYLNDGASVEQMRYYAGCINLLYPAPYDNITSLWIKAGILAAFIGVAVGIWVMRQDDNFGLLVSILLGAFFGSFAGAFAVATVAAIYYGAKYLMS